MANLIRYSTIVKYESSVIRTRKLLVVVIYDDWLPLVEQGSNYGGAVVLGMPYNRLFQRKAQFSELVNGAL